MQHFINHLTVFSVKDTKIKLYLYFFTSSQQFAWFWPKKMKTFLFSTFLSVTIVIYTSVVAPALANNPFTSGLDTFITVYTMGIIFMMLTISILSTFLIGSLCEHFTQVILLLNKDDNFHYHSKIKVII